MTLLTTERTEASATSRPIPEARPTGTNADGTPRFLVPKALLSTAAARLVERRQARLATMVGLDERDRTGVFRLAYLFALDAEASWVSLETEIDPADPAYSSVTPRVPAAHWYEREVADLLGIEPLGHPDPRRLVLHDDWPAGVYPLRRDFDPATAVPVATDYRHRFHHLHGDGIVEIPVGPIHAGVIEPGHFRFAAVGEAVLHLEARLFYTHRGVEKLAEGRTVEQALQLAERVCGACSFANALAYCQAVERLAGAEVPPRAAILRAILLELERLYNHVGDLGNLCAGVGFAVGASQGGQLKEAIQRLIERLVGNRFLHGAARLGGLRRDLDPAALGDLTATLDRVAGDFERFVPLLLGTESVVERMTATGVLAREAARDLGAVGVAARASGLRADARRDHPDAAYASLSVPEATRSGGDVLARAQVRIDETRDSFALIRQAMALLPDGPIAARIGELPSYRAAIGVTESPRGENVHWVQTGPNGTIDRWRIRSASFCNWPVVALAVPGNMVPDFPLINKSFELCYACLDR